MTPLFRNSKYIKYRLESLLCSSCLCILLSPRGRRRSLQPCLPTPPFPSVIQDPASSGPTADVGASKYCLFHMCTYSMTSTTSLVYPSKHGLIDTATHASSTRLTCLNSGPPARAVRAWAFINIDVRTANRFPWCMNRSPPCCEFVSANSAGPRSHAVYLQAISSTRDASLSVRIQNLRACHEL